MRDSCVLKLSVLDARHRKVVESEETIYIDLPLDTSKIRSYVEYFELSGAFDIPDFGRFNLKLIPPKRMKTTQVYYIAVGQIDDPFIYTAALRRFNRKVEDFYYGLP